MSKIKVLNKDNSDISNHFEDKELIKLGYNSYELYKLDEESRSKWLDDHELYLEIYHQLDTYDNNFADSFNSSDARIPILTESCLGFQARAYKALFPQRSFVAVQSLEDVTPQEQDREDRVAKWVNYDLNFRQRRYKRDKKRMLLATALMGSDFSKTYPCPFTGMPKVERVRAQDFVVAYGTGPRELEDIPRKTQIITMTLNKARKLYREGFFSELPQPTNDYEGRPGNLTQIEQEAEGMTFNLDKDNSTCVILEQHDYYDLDGDGIDEPIIKWICTQSKKILRVAANFHIDDQLKTPVEYYTHYSFIDNTDGFYCFGYGHLIAKLNQCANQILRNSVDAGELANSGNMSGFVSDTVGMPGGEIEFPIGKFIKIPRGAEDLAKSIYQMKFPGPNPSYVQMMEYIENISKRLANTTEAVSGDASKVYQPMTILTMLEQSLQLPTSIMENIALSMESELEKYFNIAAQNAPALQSFTYNKERVSVTVEDFRASTHIYPIMDPRSVTKQQKMAKAQSVYQIATTNPLIAQQPMALYQATKDVLESMEVDDLDLILPKPQNQEPQRIDDQYAENMFFLLPQQDRPFFDVFPDQDHQDHIKKIDQLLQHEAMNTQVTGQPTIPEESMQAIMLHRQKHVAYLYGQMHGVINGPRQMDIMGANAGDQEFLTALADKLQLAGQSPGMPTGESGAVPGTGGGFEGSGEVPGEGVLERQPLDQRNTGYSG